MPGTNIEIVDQRGYHLHGLVLIDAEDNVWWTFCRPWWDLAAVFWWWLQAGEKKWVQLRRKNGKKVRVRAVCLAKGYVRIGGRT